MKAIQTPSNDPSAATSMDRNPKVSIEGALYFTKLSVYIAWTWPPPIDSSKWELTKYDIAWTLSFVNALALFLPLLTTIYVHHSESIIITQTTCFICAGLNYLIKTVVYRVRREQMQILINEMEDFIKKPRYHEKMTLQSYLDSCWMFHVIITGMNYMAAIAVISGPLFFPQPLPTHAVYPFSVDSGIRKLLIYIHQSIGGIQYSASLVTDCQIGLLMWYAGAKIEILAEEFKDVRCEKQFSLFVQKHQQFLSYAEDVSDTMCYTALTTTAVATLGIVMATMQLVANEDFYLKIQSGPMILVSALNLFSVAWPAENLLRTCDVMATAVYSSSWPDMSTELMKTLQIILRRSQQPVKVSIGGFLPILSMRFYASFLTTAFSYFTTLRATVTVNSSD